MIKLKEEVKPIEKGIYNLLKYNYILAELLNDSNFGKNNEYYRDIKNINLNFNTSEITYWNKSRLYTDTYDENNDSSIEYKCREDFKNRIKEILSNSNFNHENIVLSFESESDYNMLMNATYNLYYLITQIHDRMLLNNNQFKKNMIPNPTEALLTIVKIYRNIVENNGKMNFNNFYSIYLSFYNQNFRVSDGDARYFIAGSSTYYTALFGLDSNMSLINLVGKLPYKCKNNITMEFFYANSLKITFNLFTKLVEVQVRAIENALYSNIDRINVKDIIHNTGHYGFMNDIKDKIAKNKENPKNRISFYTKNDFYIPKIEKENINKENDKNYNLYIHMFSVDKHNYQYSSMGCNLIKYPKLFHNSENSFMYLSKSDSSIFRYDKSTEYEDYRGNVPSNYRSMIYSLKDLFKVEFNITVFIDEYNHLSDGVNYNAANGLVISKLGYLLNNYHDANNKLGYVGYINHLGGIKQSLMNTVYDANINLLIEKVVKNNGYIAYNNINVSVPSKIRDNNIRLHKEELEKFKYILNLFIKNNGKVRGTNKSEDAISNYDKILDKKLRKMIKTSNIKMDEKEIERFKKRYMKMVESNIYSVMYHSDDIKSNKNILNINNISIMSNKSIDTFITRLIQAINKRYEIDKFISLDMIDTISFTNTSRSLINFSLTKKNDMIGKKKNFHKINIDNEYKDKIGGKFKNIDYNY